MGEELKAVLERREQMAPDTYRVGLATTDITPPVGIKLSGFAARTEPSTGIYRPLEATAVAIDDGGRLSSFLRGLARVLRPGADDARSPARGDWPSGGAVCALR